MSQVKISRAEQRRRSEQAARATGHSPGKKSKRELRRQQETEGGVGELAFRVRYDIELPGDGGLLRDATPIRLAGMVRANSEGELLRNVLIKVLEGFGYVREPRACAGVMAEAINAFPKAIRGNLAVALIKGTGLLVTTDQIEVCTGCGVEKTQTLAPEQPVLDDPDAEGAEPLMLDTTPHTEACHVNRITSDMGAPLNPIEYQMEDAIMVLQPPRYEPLDQPTGTPLGPQAMPEGLLDKEVEPEYDYADTSGNPIRDGAEDEASDDRGDPSAA